MSSAACVIIITSESLKLKAPSPMLEKCMRDLLGNPLVIERVGQEPEIDRLIETGIQSQWGMADQIWVQSLLRRIVKADLPDVKLP